MSDPELETTLRLVKAAQAGDDRSLNALFERYLPRTRRIVSLRMGWRLRQLEEFEDLVQEALLKVFQGLQRFEARSEGSFRHWVARCAECAIRDAARTAKRRKRGGGFLRRLSEVGDMDLSTAIFAADGPTASQVVRAAELEKKIEDCLLKLPERYREVIVLKSFCEMSHAEVAETLGLEREGTARQAYSRAVHKLQELLEE